MKQFVQNLLKDKKFAFLLSLFLLTGVILRCWNINQSFWWDELWGTIPYARADSLWTVISDLGYFYNNHILYSLLCRVSVHLLGENEFSARLPALFMGIAGIYVLFKLGQRFAGAGPGLIAALLLSVSAFHIDHSTEARGYSGLMLCALLSSLCYLVALKTNRTNTWVLFIVSTVLGFYFHVYMVWISIAQFCSMLIFYILQRMHLHLQLSGNTFKKFWYALFSAALITIVLYLPIMRHFIGNLDRVRTVGVDRMPFIFDLLNTIFPGVLSLPGFILYSILVAAGLVFIWKKDRRLFIYIMVLFFVPFYLYLLINPMFFFKRYFLFTLPFALLTIGCGICAVADLIRAQGAYKNGFVLLIVGAIIYIQAPSIKKIITEDRQNYREAVRYVEQESGITEDVLVVSLGYAGRFFQYYSQAPLIHPETFDEFIVLVNKTRYTHVWCLMSAWLPLMRAPHEDEILYAEHPEHEKIYNYVIKHFMLRKEFVTKFPTRIYSLR